jgi:hypothetical protein
VWCGAAKPATPPGVAVAWSLQRPGAMRRILTRIVLLAVPVAVGCSTDSNSSTSQGFNLLDTNNNCVSHLSFKVSVDDIEHASPPAQLRIESCRLDVDACSDLCSFQLAALAKQPGFQALLQPGGGFQGQPIPVNGAGAPPGTPINPGGITNPFTPTKCTVKFDGNSVTSEIGFDSFVSNSNCATFQAPNGAGMGGVK